MPRRLVLPLLLSAAHLHGARGLTPPNTSLATLPVAYFTGVSDASRSEASVTMLAKQRFILIEKFEGPCFGACAANQSKGLPCSVCDSPTGRYRLDTLRRVKEANPAVSCGYYQNSLYLWSWQQLYADFAAHGEALRSSNGSLVHLQSDPGISSPVFDWSKPSAVDRFTRWLHNLTSTGYVDGIFSDKSDVVPIWNESARSWQICEGPHGHQPGAKHLWINMCALLTNETAELYTQGKRKVINAIAAAFDGGFSVTGKGKGAESGDPGSMAMIGPWKDDMPTFIARVPKLLKSVKYVYLHHGGCKEKDVAAYLLVAEERTFLGCNGWEDYFGNPLGDPIAPAAVAGDIYTRNFSSGTSVWYDASTYNSGHDKFEILWASRT